MYAEPLLDPLVVTVGSGGSFTLVKAENENDAEDDSGDDDDGGYDERRNDLD